MLELTYLLATILTVEVLSVNANRFCQVNSCKPGQHTMCQFPSPQPARQCVAYKSTSLTEQEKKELLHTHNALRARVAAGRETRGVNGPQPAGHIPPLKWDEELAEIAQRWANQCVFDHDRCRNVGRFEVGQNVAYRGWSGGYITQLSQLVNDWYDEVDNFDRRWISPFKSGGNTDHYTQIVWGKTSTIGCGLVRYKNDNMFTTHLVCNYGQKGNMLGETMYETRQRPTSVNKQTSKKNFKRIPYNSPKQQNTEQSRTNTCLRKCMQACGNN